MREKRLDSISVEEIEMAVNERADSPYSRAEIIVLLEVKSLLNSIHLKKYC